MPKYAEEEDGGGEHGVVFDVFFSSGEVVFGGCDSHYFDAGENEGVCEYDGEGGVEKDLSSM